MSPISRRRRATSCTPTRRRIGRRCRCQTRSALPRTPHNNNIRAEIEQAATLFDVDMRMMKAFAKIESGYNPKAKTGKYKCLFQLSDWEFAKYWQGDIYDIRDCSIAAARKFATEAAQFEKDVGRKATAAELYCIHQQGYQGCAFHYAAPHQLAWKNMYLTSEGQEKGEKWARKAIWGNVPSDLKNKIKGGVEALTSGQFIALWTERVNRFMARKVEPPTHYVQHASKAKKPTKLATTDKKKTKSVAIKKEKMTKLRARWPSRWRAGGMSPKQPTPPPQSVPSPPPRRPAWARLGCPLGAPRGGPLRLLFSPPFPRPPSLSPPAPPPSFFFLSPPPPRSRPPNKGSLLRRASGRFQVRWVSERTAFVEVGITPAWVKRASVVRDAISLGSPDASITA